MNTMLRASWLSEGRTILPSESIFSNSKLFIIFWDLCNLIEGLQYKIELFNEEQLEEISLKARSELGLLLKNLKNSPPVLINKFTALPFCSSTREPNNYEMFAAGLNEYLEKERQAALKL